MEIRPTGIAAGCRAALAVFLLAFAAPSALAELSVLIDNRSCGAVTVELPDAPPCGADGRICTAVARNGFTTRLAVDQAFNENYLRLVMRGECSARNMQLKGDCTVKVKKISQIERSIGAPGDPMGVTALAVQAQATLVAVEITQGICENQDGVRHCELTCRARDQQ